MPEAVLSKQSEQATLLEIAFSESPKVDREKGLIRGVKILGKQSQNGRTYSNAALEEAAHIYEGIGVNIDHAPPGTSAPNRCFADGFGYLQNIHQQDESVYGDLVYLKTHHLAEQICEAAERMPHHFGLSHHAEGTVTRDGETTLVDHISHVHSVDIVRNPATSNGLFESISPTTLSTDPSSVEQSTDDLSETIVRLEAEIESRKILESMGIPSTATRLKALVAMTTDSDRRTLARSWIGTSMPQPRSSEPRNLESFSESRRRTSLPEDAASFARALR